MSRGRHDRRTRPRIVAGLHPVRELLRAGHGVRRVELASGREPSSVLDEILVLADQARIEVAERDRSALDELADGVVHQGVVAVADPYPYLDLDGLRAQLETSRDPALLVALDSITDPHNLGSIARTAEAVGAQALLIPARRAAHVTPAAEKAAAGALAHLPVARVANLARALEVLGRDHIWTVGLDGDAETSVYDLALAEEPLVLVLGSEGRGLARLSQVRCDALVHLPMCGEVASLNASVAAAVALYEIRRRRHAFGPGP